MNSHPNGQVGALVVVRKAGFGRQAKVLVELIGRRDCVPISVANLVAKLGLPAIEIEP
jgi:hypothetical protein